MMAQKSLFTRQALEQHSVDMRQFIDFRPSVLPNGVPIIEAYNGSGLTFTVLPDRGLDIWTAHYNGLPLTWISQGSPFPPDAGSPWLRQFNGGLLTTCGLTHVGPPETDPDTGEFRDLHGQYTRLRATDVAVRRAGWSRGDRQYTVELSGVIAQTGLFKEQLRCERTYTLPLGEPEIRIFDQVTNLGDQAAPLMVLYHVNVGYPLVMDGDELHTSYEAVYPRDEPARAGLHRWEAYDAGTPGYAEQVFFHHVRHSKTTTRSAAALLRKDFGFMVEWDTAEMPYLTQWKNTRQGIYVNGIEPGNCLPEGQIAARRNKRLVMIQPGESRTFSCVLSVLPDSRAVQAAKNRIRTLRETGIPARGCQLKDYAKKK